MSLRSLKIRTAGQGLEPQYSPPEGDVLPLDEPATAFPSYLFFLLFSTYKKSTPILRHPPTGGGGSERCIFLSCNQNTMRTLPQAQGARSRRREANEQSPLRRCQAAACWIYQRCRLRFPSARHEHRGWKDRGLRILF